MRTEAGEKRAMEIRKEYQRQNMRTLGVNLRKEDAERFKKIAEARGMTASRLLHDYVSSVLKGIDEEVKPMHAPRTAFDMRVTEKNLDRLFHEVSFNNPKNLNPETMMNDILDRYFKLAEEIRKTTSR